MLPRVAGEPRYPAVDLTRREFLHAGSLAAGALALSACRGSSGARPAAKNCILLLLVGGPSHIDTWDPKPDAPLEIRGPFQTIQTNVPGIHLTELFPGMARRVDRIALVRSVHHDAAPIHETGQQLLQTGHLCQSDQEFPHIGAAITWLRGPGCPGMPGFMIVPGPITNTGVAISHGQSAGFLGSDHEPTYANSTTFGVESETARLREQYGLSAFGSSCVLARQLVERGVRLVTVNMFDTVYNSVTWDCHAAGSPLSTTLDDYRNVVCPVFDQAYSMLLDDLDQRGLLATTLVVAMGEFGRTPRLNAHGGRDHWPGVWTILFAGGGVRGGQVIGASDRIGAEPNERPITPSEVVASIYAAFGISPQTCLPAPDQRLIPLVDAAPIRELY